MIWALEKFKYFLNDDVIVRNDHQALQWLVSVKEPQNRLARWIMRLSNFNYRLEHIRGKENVIADILSRVLLKEPKIEVQMVEIETKREISESQKEEMIVHAHDLAGLSGKEVTLAHVKSYTQWEKMKQDVSDIIDKCEVCKNHEKLKQNFTKYCSTISGPFEKIGIDVIGPLPKGEGKMTYIVAATDYATRWAEAKAIKTKSAEEIGRFIFENIFLRHGPPKLMISDQGTEFLNQIVKNMCKRMDVQHSSNSAYNPQTNGVAERFNRTLILKLAKTI